jgi:hypothetical protein
MHGLLMPPVLVLALAASAGSEPGGPRMTTATAEYCGSLAARLAALPSGGAEPSRSLGAEGVRLCGNGQFRIGVAKLRRALRAASAAHPSP